MSNEYYRKQLINEIDQAIQLLSRRYEPYTKREQIVFKQNIDTLEAVIRGYCYKEEQGLLVAGTVEYITSRIVLAAKTGQVQTLQQTYREYKQVGGEIPPTTQESKLDKIMSCCPKESKNTKEILEKLYKNADVYAEEAWKQANKF